MMKKICLVSALVLLLGSVTACNFKHEYVWHAYPIQPDKVPAKVSVVGNREVRVISGESGKENIFLGDVGPHKYYGSEQTLTDGIADLLAQELNRSGFRISDGAQKTLEIAVMNTEFNRGIWKIAAIIQFSLRLGNGKIKYYIVRNSSPFSVSDLYDGGAAQAVIAIINDPDVLTYIFQ